MERKIYNYKSIILNELTLEKEGFDPKLTGYQKKYIWAVCRFCGQPSRLLGLNFKKSGSACHKECRFKEQSIMGSPLKDEKIRAKAYANRNKNFTKEEINKKISDGMKLVYSKIEQTNLEKYGVKNVFQNEKIKQKIKDTNIAKYGAENPQQNEEIRDKTQISFDRSIINNDYYDLVNTLRGEEFWKTLLNDSLKQTCEKFNLNYNSVLGRLQNNEFVDKYYQTYTFPTQQQQKEIAEFIKSLNITVTENNRSIITPLELDIYIPNKKIAIEFNGSLWHSELKLLDSAKQKHIQKTKLCKEKGIRLIHIFENQWNNKKDQWKTFLRSVLGKNEIKVPARKCIISFNKGRELINLSHIQGYPNHIIKTFDLIYNDEIIGTTAFSHHHRINNNTVLVLSRMAFKDNITVQGGASKMFHSSIEWAKEANYSRIISWSDNAWTEGNIYTKLGFSLIKKTGPDYFYWNSKNNTYLSKQSQKKSSVNCPKHLTEKEWATERGLYRIWDCGKYTWEYKL